jgi:Pyridoxamine 5'-phosphate oxidase
LGKRLVVATTRGSDLDRAIGSAAVPAAVVAIAVDNIDDPLADDGRAGTWTILVTGQAGDLHHPAELDAAARRLTGPAGRSSTAPTRFLQLSTDLMSGTLGP